MSSGANWGCVTEQLYHSPSGDKRRPNPSTDSDHEMMPVTLTQALSMRGDLWNNLFRLTVRLRNARGGCDTGFLPNAKSCRRAARGLNWYQLLGCALVWWGLVFEDDIILDAQCWFWIWEEMILTKRPDFRQMRRFKPSPWSWLRRTARSSLQKKGFVAWRKLNYTWMLLRDPLILTIDPKFRPGTSKYTLYWSPVEWTWVLEGGGE